MFNKEPSEGQALEGLNESAPSAGSAQPAPVGNKIMMAGLIPTIALVLSVLLSFAGVTPIVGVVLLLIGAGGFFFMWKQASSALNSSLDALRDEAYAVANEDLPRLGHAISTGAPISEITNNRKAVNFTDPAFASVAGGLNAVRDSAGGIGGSVSELQKGISDTYVNLARRNQALVDRQLEAIDTLEAEERDSDKLALLYRVDHLATRMHRNAESLLVLADAKTPERHSPPVALREVLRVAIGEVEDYRRIVPISLDEISVAGPKAQNMAHLLAELMENSAQHSPPGTAVDVTGALDSRTGDYAITILDHGTGMAADQMTELNELLAKPPTSTLTISHSIGLQVVSRIAEGLGIQVRLNHGEGGGVITSVNIPSAVVAAWAQGSPTAGAAPAAPAAPAPASPTPAPAATPAAAPVASAASVAPAPAAPAPAPAAPAPAPAAPAPAPAAPEAAAPAFPTVGIEPTEAKAPSPFQMPAPSPVAETAPAAPAPAPAEPEPVVFEPGNSTFEMPKTEAPVAEAPPAEPVVFEPGNSTFEMPKTEAAPQVAAPEPTAPAAADLKAEPAPKAEAAAAPVAAAGGAAVAAGAATVDAATTPDATAAAAAPSTGGKLTKRKRSAPGSTPSANLDEIRTAPSQRSPDQVKSMLSRYKSGLERGRGPAETDGES